CGIPTYSLEPTAPCLTCGNVQKLSINPAMIGPLIDETGALEAEKLQWTPKAWEEFLGEAGAMAILGGEKGADETRDINEVHSVNLELRRAGLALKQASASRATGIKLILLMLYMLGAVNFAKQKRAESGEQRELLAIIKAATT
ncbi:hypothetical protein V495_04610, partial [Pseudogymnoascus sp. VKM F-4514 (FW-929)]